MNSRRTPRRLAKTRASPLGSRSRSGLLLLCLAGFVSTSGCASPERLPYQSDPHPTGRPEDLASIVTISSTEDVPGFGSGIVLGENRILTALHVLEPYWTGGDDWFAIRIGAKRATARIRATGDIASPHGDWALIEVKSVRLPEPARIHRAALDPDWEPPLGLEVHLAGYAVRFYEDKRVDPREPPATVTMQVREPPEAADRGTAWFGTARGRDLSGASGGGAFIRDTASGQLELIGMFIGRTNIRRRLEGPFGIGVGLGSTRAHRFVRLPGEVTNVR